MLDFSNVQTKDGRSVEIISTTGRGKYPILGYIGEHKSICSWTRLGYLYDEATSSCLDLVPIQKEITKRWLVILLTKWNMPFHCVDHFGTEEEAEQYAKSHRAYIDYKIIALHDLFKE